MILADRYSKRNISSPLILFSLHIFVKRNSPPALIQAVWYTNTGIFSVAGTVMAPAWLQASFLAERIQRKGYCPHDVSPQFRFFQPHAAMTEIPLIQAKQNLFGVSCGYAERVIKIQFTNPSIVATSSIAGSYTGKFDRPREIPVDVSGFTTFPLLLSTW